MSNGVLTARVPWGHAYLKSFSIVGLLVGTLFFRPSLSPSLVPRAAVLQGALSGLTLARVVAERSAVSPEMALRLSKALGRSPESWLAMQDNHDLWQARKSANLSKVRKIPFAANA